MTAAPPSEICDALPAVTVPSFAKAGRSFPSDSIVESARTPSSIVTSARCLIWLASSGMISSLYQPSDVAVAARACEVAANSSCSSLEISYSPAVHSAAHPIPHPSNGQVKPSCCI